MTENEKLIEKTDRIVNDLVSAHGFHAIGAILGSAAAMAIVNGHEPYLRDVLGLLDNTIDQMAERWKGSTQ